jgi:hypothetical protein
MMNKRARIRRARRSDLLRKYLRPVKGIVTAVHCWPSDAAENRRWTRSDRRIMLLRHGRKNPQAYRVIVDWLAENHPDVRSHFELRTLPLSMRQWSSYALCVMWLPDPVQQWSASAYRQAGEVARQCETQRVPVINSVDRLSNATKLEGARRISSVGIRVPRMVRIEDPKQFRLNCCGIEPPLIVREDWGHNRLMIKVDSLEEARALNLSWFERPLAVQYIDVADRHGVFRKYRYVAVGEIGISLSVHAQLDWETRGTNTLDTRELIAEEEAYVNRPNEHDEAFQRARRALDLDYVAFDYGYDHDGHPIVWEANPFPLIHLKSGGHAARRDAYVRVIQALLRLYLTRGDLPVPTSIEEGLDRYLSQ